MIKFLQEKKGVQRKISLKGVGLDQRLGLFKKGEWTPHRHYELARVGQLFFD